MLALVMSLIQLLVKWECEQRWCNLLRSTVAFERTIRRWDWTVVIYVRAGRRLRPIVLSASHDTELAFNDRGKASRCISLDDFERELSYMLALERPLSF